MAIETAKNGRKKGWMKERKSDRLTNTTDPCWRKIFSRLGYCIKFTPLSFMTFEKYHNIMPFLSFYYVVLFITKNDGNSRHTSIQTYRYSTRANEQRTLEPATAKGARWLTVLNAIHSEKWKWKYKVILQVCGASWKILWNFWNNTYWCAHKCIPLEGVRMSNINERYLIWVCLWKNGIHMN